MNWGSSEERAALVERVGIDEYNRLYQEHVKQMTCSVINGYRIHMVNSNRFGDIFAVEGTGVAFHTLQEAEDFAATLTPLQ